MYDFDRFKADDLLPLFKKYNITTFCAPPTMYRFFIKEDLSRYDLSSLHYVTIAGEALNPEVFQPLLRSDRPEADGRIRSDRNNAGHCQSVRDDAEGRFNGQA